MPSLGPDRVKEMNARVLSGLNLEPGVTPGVIRHRVVGVGRYRGPPAEDCEYLLGRLSTWLNDPDFDSALGDGSSILKAIVAHLYIAWIHPFGDGNGRTARLAEYQLLVASGVPSPAAHLLSNHYNETRTEYYRQLDIASQPGRGPVGFFLYALEGFVDGLRDQLRVIRDQQSQVAWANYVHGEFRDRVSPADIRRLHLVLDLSQQDEPVPLRDLRLLTPRLAVAYADKTSKTLTRDINLLEEKGLVERTAEGLIYANKNVILAFLPIAGPVDPTQPDDSHLRLRLD